MALTRKGKEIEEKKWEFRRKDCSSSESDGSWVVKTNKFVSSDCYSSESNGDWVVKTNKIVHSEDSRKRTKSASSVHPSASSVPPKPYPSDRLNKSQQALAKTDGMNPDASHQTHPPLSGMDFVCEYDQEAEGSIGDRVGEMHASTPSEHDQEADGSGRDRVGGNHASTLSEHDQEAERFNEDRLGAKSSSTVSGSDEEAEESDGNSVRSKGAKSASTVSLPDNEADESDGDRGRNKRVKTSNILSPKGFAKRSPSESDRMKKIGEEQAAIDRVNPDASRPPHRPYNKSFLTEQNCSRFKSFLQKGVVDQRLVDLESFASLGVKQILKENHLLSTVTCVEPYVLEVVMEFYANLPSNETDRLVKKIYIRGKMYEFSPKLINAVLELPSRKVTRAKETLINVDLNLIAATLTGGNIIEWTKNITPANLSPPVAALHGICCSNWIPTSNPCTLTLDRAKLLYMLVEKIPFNFGKLAYDQICRLGHLEGSKHTPVFPSLIYKVLNYQRPIPLDKGESLSYLAKPICYHIRLSRGKHVSPSLPSSGKRKHVSSPSPSGRFLPSTSACCEKVQAYQHEAMAFLVNDRHRLNGGKELKGYLDVAMALIRMVSESLEADEETNDDDTRT